MKRKLLLINFLISLSLYAAFPDLSRYVLKPFEVDLLMRLYKNRNFSQERIIEYAEVFHKKNTQSQAASEYIPPYEEGDLEKLEKWARGAAYFSFAEQAQVTFDRDQYNEDCPNWALFGFLRATGREYIDFDVMRGNINANFQLNYILNNEPQSFAARYLELARQDGFMKYIIN